MRRGGTARPRETEWSSGVAAFCGGCYNQDIFKDPKISHYHNVSVLVYIIRICETWFHIENEVQPATLAVIMVGVFWFIMRVMMILSLDFDFCRRSGPRFRARKIVVRFFFQILSKLHEEFNSASYQGTA